ncbi:RNA recognition motif domain-containing protein [Patescibacteria group bacterium]
MKKLYVGNLPYSVTSEQLSELFTEFGEVLSAIVITDKYSGRSKGFGFVELEDEAADAAMAGMEGKEIDGRNLKVSEARPREEN